MKTPRRSIPALAAGVVALALSDRAAAEIPASNPPALFVVVPEQSGIADAGLRSSFEARLLALAGRSGLAGTGAIGDFVLFPRVAVVKQEVAEGGLQAIDVVGLDVTLVVKDARKNVVFDTFTASVEGGGRGATEATRSALLSIGPGTPGLSAFLSGSRQKIVDYYEAACGEVLATADVAARKGEIEASLAGLAAVPSAAPACFGKATARMRALLKARETAFCERALSRGQGRVALGDFSGAVRAVSGLGGSATACGERVSHFVADVEAKVKDRADRDWKAAWRVYEDRLRADRESARRDDAMETKRLETARAIAESWARGQPLISTRNFIFR